MKTSPRTGRKVRGSETGRPIMALLDLLGRRWTLRVIWELRDARLTFRQLAAACGDISPTVLNTRLRELRDAALVEDEGGEGYGLGARGRELVASLVPLVGFAEKWARELPRDAG